MSEGAQIKLGGREYDALVDIAGWGATPYIWKQSSMRKLEAIGFVEATGRKYGSAVAYVITDAGRRHLERAR